MLEKRKWITHDQLDTPLCRLFPDITTTATARLYVKIACFSLGQTPLDLSKLTYTELNEYIEELEFKVAKL